jgi:hypothetical protein
MYKGSDSASATTMLPRNTQCDSFQECELNKDTRATTDNSMVETSENNVTINCDAYLPTFQIM